MADELSRYKLPVSDVDFQDERHVYIHHGYRIPSVTQVMEPMSLMLYAKVPDDVLYDAACRGTRVHEQISNYIKYGVAEEDEETKPYLQAYQAFVRDYQPVWIASEYRINHRTMGYAGTVDLVGLVVPDDGTGVDVVDIKTTAQYHSVMLSTQVGAYAEAIASHGVTIRKRYGLQLMRDGKYRFEGLEDGFKLFLHCLAIWSAMSTEKHA